MRLLLSILIVGLFVVSFNTTHAATLAELQAQLLQLQAQLKTMLLNDTSAPKNCVQLSQTLTLGASDKTANGQVGKLQQFLRAEGVFTYHTLTGYYGPITAEAVKTWQIKHGVLMKNYTIPFGTVDSQTLSWMAYRCESEDDFLFKGEKTGYFKKGNNVFFSRIEGREGIDWFFSKSEKDAVKIEQADVDTFRVIASEPAEVGIFFALDKNHVYVEHKVLENADPSTAEVFGRGNAFLLSDKGLYLSDTFVTAGPKSDIEIFGIKETEGASAFHVFVHKKSTDKWYSTATSELVGVKEVSKPTSSELDVELYSVNREVYP